MVHANAADSANPSKNRYWKVLLGLAIVVLVAAVVGRLIALQSDVAVANIVTLIGGFFTWLLLTLGLALSPWSRAWWRILALTPVVVIAIVLSQYRIVRLDGALVPQLQSRWRPPPALPQADQATSAGERLISDAALKATEYDFPQFLGPQRDGVVPGLKIAADWKAQPPTMLWKQPIGSGWAGFAVQGSVAVTVEQRDREQWVSAYNVEDGRLFWSVAWPGSHFNVLGGAGPRATPTIDNDLVYALTAVGQLVCIELATGKKVWEQDLLKLVGWDQAASEKSIPWGRSGSPLVVDQLLIVPLGGPDTVSDRSLVAFNKLTGEVAWRTGTEQISYSSPSYFTLLDVPQIVIVNASSVSGHDVASGQQLWRTPWDGHSDGAANVSQTVWVDGSHLLISKGYAQGAKLVELSRGADQQWSSRDVWQKSAALKTKFTSAVKRGDYAYGLSDGTLECIRISDGKRQWKGGRYGNGQLLIVGDKLLITAESGALVLVAASTDQYQELAKFEVLSDTTWNVPALAGNRLLMRNADQAACVALPVEAASSSQSMSFEAGH